VIVDNPADRFGEDKLQDLPLSDYDHVYDIGVLDAINDSSINSGDIYYPLINAFTYMDIGNSAVTDLYNASNTIAWQDFKPALRILRIIEAIETKYSISFSRDFFDRSVFYNIFMWLHREAGRMKTSSTSLLVDYTSKTTTEADWTITPDEIDLTTNSVRLNWTTGFVGSGFIQVTRKFTVSLQVLTSSTVNYKVETFDNGVLFETFDNLYGDVLLTIYNKRFNEDSSNHLFTFKISSLEGNATFSTNLYFIAFNPGAATPVFRKLTEYPDCN